MELDQTPTGRFCYVLAVSGIDAPNGAHRFPQDPLRDAAFGAVLGEAVFGDAARRVVAFGVASPVVAVRAVAAFMTPDFAVALRVEVGRVAGARVEAALVVAVLVVAALVEAALTVADLVVAFRGAAAGRPAGARRVAADFPVALVVALARPTGGFGETRGRSGAGAEGATGMSSSAMSSSAIPASATITGGSGRGRGTDGESATFMASARVQPAGGGLCPDRARDSIC